MLREQSKLSVLYIYNPLVISINIEQKASKEKKKVFQWALL